jgi:hypothetical protein
MQDEAVEWIDEVGRLYNDLVERCRGLDQEYADAIWRGDYGEAYVLAWNLVQMNQLAHALHWATRGDEHPDEAGLAYAIDQDAMEKLSQASDALERSTGDRPHRPMFYRFPADPKAYKKYHKRYRLWRLK